MKIFKRPPVTKQDFHLKVTAEYVDFLNSLPAYRDVSTTQLWFALPEKYRKHIPPIVNKNDRATRAAIIGLIALPIEIETQNGVQFLERL